MYRISSGAFVAVYANQTNLSVVYAVEVVIARQSVVVNSERGKRSVINIFIE